MTLYDLTQHAAIELAEDFCPAFKKTNPLFAFDRMQCERTLSFDIPATPRNNVIFVNSKNPNNAGIGMRVRHAAQLQGSMVAMDGALYVTEYSDGVYKAVFVTGELIGLRALKEAGNVSEYVNTDAVTTWDSMASLPSTEKGTLWAQIDYGTDKEYPFPSVRLHGLIELAMQALGVSVSLPSATQYVRIIPEELSGASETDETFVATASAMSTTTHPVCYTIRMEELTDLVATTQARVRRQVGTGASAIVYMGIFQQFWTKQELQLEFPDDWDDDIFVGYFLDGDTNLIGEFAFLGDRSFDDTGTVTGESLRGRSVTIHQGDKFVFISKSCWVNQQTSSGQEYGWSPYGINVTLKVSGGEVSVGATVRLQDNLPKTDVVTLLKMVSALSGLQLYYDEGTGVSFVTGERTALVRLDGKVISESTLTRTYADYGQKNVVKFASEERMPERDKMTVTYDVENANLQAENVLMEIPYSEGIANGLYGGQTLLYTRAAALANADTQATKMVRVTLNENKVLQSLCANSTSIKVKVWMTLVEYQRLRASTYLFYRNAYWLWSEANWSKGVATVSLSMVDDEMLPVPDVWMPLNGSYDLTGEITTLPQTLDGNFYYPNQGLDLLQGGGAKVRDTVVAGTRGIGLMTFNVPYAIFAKAHGSVPANSITAALWLRIDAADITAHNIDLMRETMGLIFGTPDGYNFFGMVFTTGYGYVEPLFGNRNPSEHVTDSYGAMPTDTWVHYAFTVDIDTMVVTGYKNGARIFSRAHPQFDHWIWALQAPNWVMAGNYRAPRFPFQYRDVRIYSRALTDGQISKVVAGM